MQNWILSLVALAGLTHTTLAHAGFVEVGASANYRSSNYDKNNYITSLTYTASASYYFWQMSALELNYTTGYSKQVQKGTQSTDKKFTTEDLIELTSLDLVMSFAERSDPFRPYIKVGGGYLTKTRYTRVDNDPRRKLKTIAGIVPSAGFGVSINLTQELSVKVGLEAWTTPLEDKEIVVDYAGRAGISWLF